MTVGQRLELGPFTFTVLRILIAVGFIRTIVRREHLTGGFNRLDLLTLAWGIWAGVCSVFHQPVSTILVYHLGIVYNVWGFYFLLRIFCTSLADVERLCRSAAFVLLPVAAEMVYEQVAFRNLFSILGGVPEFPMIRDGRIRAGGPFAHPILAGSVGGVTLPLMMGLWRHQRIAACIGMLVCVTMVVASASSGPAMSALVGVGAVCMWRMRGHMRAFRWMLVGIYVVLTLVMTRPAYYIIQRLEVVGGSTGWYRSRLIEVALTHINEWWLAGTDYTRHWMFGNAVDANHIDLTNHYIALAVMGGLPLLLLHIAMLATAYSFVGRGFVGSGGPPVQRQFMLWTLGCALAAHTVTTISVSYYDQSLLFLYLTLAAIGSAHTGIQAHAVKEVAPVAAAGVSTRWQLEPVRLSAHSTNNSHP